jgi:hypothetical protein
MFEESMLQQFSEVFVKAVKGEMDSMKRRLGSFELPVRFAGKKDDLLEFSLFSPTDKLNRAMQCTLRTESNEYAVEVADIQADRCLLSCARNPLLNVESTAYLVIYPWFLYEKLISGMEELVNSQNTPGIDLAFKAFGKLKANVGMNAGILDAESGLNRSQREAVEYSLGSDVSFIWGPPGTGKTHTLARLLGEFLELGKRVLVTSTTNSAVDTVIDKMIDLDLALEMRNQGKVARLGRPHGEHDEVNIDHVLNRINGDLLKQIGVIGEELNQLNISMDRAKRLLEILEESTDQIDLFGNPGSSMELEREYEKDLNPFLPQNWADLTIAGKKAFLTEAFSGWGADGEDHKERLDSLKKALIRDPKAVVNRSELLFSTMASLYTGNMLEGELFDMVVIEEAGMAVLPALFYSLTRAREKVVLVGDPMQLPPVVQSNDAYVKRAMGRSIYQVGLEDDLSDQTVHLLDTQYRMHPQIGDMISRLFYQGKLKNGIDGASRESLAALEPASGQPFCPIDLKGKSLCQRKEGSSSRYNEVSAQTCISLLKGVPSSCSVALITPYADQSRLLNDMIRAELKEHNHIECSTIHRFQGQERDLVILDLTDSEPLKPGILVTGEYGRNLLNVALSRARGKLIVVSERAYFIEKAPHSVIHELLEYRGL